MYIVAMRILITNDDGINAHGLDVLEGIRRMDPSAITRNEPAARAKGQIRAGLQYAWRHRRLRTAFVMMALVGGLAYNFPVVYPLLAKRDLGGTVSLDGHVVPAGTMARTTDDKRAMQMVFQNPFDTLNPSHTVGSQIMRTLEMFGVGKTTEERRQRMLELLDLVKLPRAFEQRMANSGIPVGSEAYNDALSQHEKDKNFALADAARAATTQGAQLALSQRQQLGEASAIQRVAG